MSYGNDGIKLNARKLIEGNKGKRGMSPDDLKSLLG